MQIEKRLNRQIKKSRVSSLSPHLGKITDTEAMKWIEHLYGWNEKGVILI